MDSAQETVSEETISEETVEVPAPGSFSPDDDLSTLLVKAYQGEVSGEVLFGAVGDRSDDADHGRKMELLRLLEHRTKQAMVPAMDHHGLSTDPDPTVVSDAQALAEALASVSWTDFVAAFEPITTQFIALYRRIGELADDEVDRAAADLLVAHEEALREFGRREHAGRSEDSTALIAALPHMM
jgi:hypothetical protein